MGWIQHTVFVLGPGNSLIKNFVYYWFSHSVVQASSYLLSKAFQALKPVCPDCSRNYFLWIDYILTPIPHWACSVDVLRDEKFPLWIADTPVQSKNLRLKGESCGMRVYPGQLILQKTKTQLE